MQKEEKKLRLHFVFPVHSVYHFMMNRRDQVCSGASPYLLFRVFVASDYLSKSFSCYMTADLAGLITRFFLSRCVSCV